MSQTLDEGVVTKRSQSDGSAHFCLILSVLCFQKPLKTSSTSWISASLQKIQEQETLSLGQSGFDTFLFHIA